MDCVCLISKPFNCGNPFERYIRKQHQKQISKKKEQFYSKILKFTASRYPLQFLRQLQKQINPFQHSLETLRGIILEKYPDLPDDVVNQCVEYVFGKKAREATMIKQSQTIIEEGEETIKNGRKLIKQDFSLFLEEHSINISALPSDTSRYNTTFDNILARTDRGQSTKRSLQQYSIKPHTPQTHTLQEVRRQVQNNPLPEDKGILGSARRRKLPISKNELFNQILTQQIDHESKRYQNLEIIYENTPEDLIVKEDMTRRTQVSEQAQTSKRYQRSMPRVIPNDLLQVDEDEESGKADVEALKRFLTKVAMKCEDKEELTNLSERGMYMTKINDKNLKDLYTVQGNIKMNVVKRTANRLISEYD